MFYCLISTREKHLVLFITDSFKKIALKGTTTLLMLMEPLCVPKVGRDINMLFALKNKGVGKNCGGLLRNR